MSTIFEMKPYESVGLITFGMKKVEVKKLLGEPDSITNRRRVDLRWANLSVKIDSKFGVNEVSFLKGPKKIFFGGVDLMSEPNLEHFLNKIEKPSRHLGFSVYFSLGVAITGFSDIEENSTINIFSKDLIAFWQNFVANKIQ